MTSRRDFLKSMAAASGWLALGGPGATTSRAASGFPPGAWGGNYPSNCHDLRDGKKFPTPPPSRRVEVVIVGGGLAGLTAGYKLRDTNVLVLEHLDRIGGHAVRDRWNGVWYSGAAAYFVEPEEPLDALYAELDFPLKKIAEPADSAILAWNMVLDTFGAGIDKLPYPAHVRKDFHRARKDFIAILEGDDCPLMPIGDTSEASKKYDTLSFADWMLKEQKYHPAVKAYVDLYCRSAFGAPSSKSLSAFAGLNFYVSEFSDRYTFPGGNALAAEILRDRIDAAGADRIVSGATVVSVEQSSERVLVTYVDRNGRPSSVEAKACIFAAPKYMALNVVKGLPEDQVAAMGGLQYGGYLVANVLCKSPIAQSSYDTWTDVASFTDFIVADWIARGPDGKATGVSQVLTIYWPFPRNQAQLLKDEAYDPLRQQVVEELDLLIPGAASKIEDVRLYRWGHALCHAGPGWYTQQAHVASRDLGRVIFGHSDNQGLPAFESALPEGLTAAEKVRELLGRS